MDARLIKGGFHLMMVFAALCEYRDAKTPFRKGLIGGFGGFHLAMALVDFTDDDPEDD